MVDFIWDLHISAQLARDISNSVKREFAKDSVEIYDICQGVSNRG